MPAPSWHAPSWHAPSWRAPSWRHAAVLAVALLGLSAPACAAKARAAALASDFPLCQRAIVAAEKSARLPEELLGSVAIVESGRLDSRSGRVAPWPWTINVGGTGRFFPTKDAAIDAVRQAQAEGRNSIDVGCMQVNLLHHPKAFATLDQAFDPAANAVYAAGFLSRLHAQLGTWPAAAAAYHSQTPGIADAYRKQVMAIWPLAAKFAAAPEPDLIDPQKVYTPEFRDILRQHARDRARWAEMGVVRAPVLPGPRARLGVLADSSRPLHD